MIQECKKLLSIFLEPLFAFARLFAAAVEFS